MPTQPPLTEEEIEGAALLEAVRVAAGHVKASEAALETNRQALSNLMRKARERFSLAKVAEAAGVSREWVRRLTQ